MNTKNLIFVVLALIGLNSAIVAQQKYAVLIAGDNNAVNVPTADRWNQGNGMGQYGFDEFWNDTYLFWEMLYTEKGYSNENIFVCYDDGVDFTFPLQDDRYNAFITYNFNITDQSSTKSNIQNLFTNTLASLVTQDDFLYVWIMSHGGNTLPSENSDSYIYLWGYDPVNPNAGRLYDTELKEMLDNINALKKVVFIQAPNAGGFAEKLQSENTIIFTSSKKDENSFRCDNLTNNQTFFEENEVIDGIIYNHGEFNFHLYSSLVGETPVIGNNVYNGQNLISAPDLNEDNHKSIFEAVKWELQETSNLDETPQFSDIGVLKENTAVEYPTIIFDIISTSNTFKGLIGVTKVVTINNNSTVSFEKAQIELVNNQLESIILFYESNMTIGAGSKIIGGYSNASIWAEGIINIQNNVIFTSLNGLNWFGLYFSHDNDLHLNNVTFENCFIWTGFPYPDGLRIENCNFTNSGILHLTNGGIEILEIKNSSFVNSFVKSRGSYNSKSTISGNCTFSGNNPVWVGSYKNAIHLTGFPEYIIDQISIQNYQGNGIFLEHCGLEPSLPNDIKRSYIRYCGLGSSGNNYAGIYALNSHVLIQDNYNIGENTNGIISTDNSRVKIIGDKSAEHVTETQNIKGNSVNQLMATSNSFPYYVKWNAIYDDDANEPLVYYSNEGTSASLDISNNFWGDYFNPLYPGNYFSPLSIFQWQPYWELNTGPIETSEDELLYESAQQNEFSENFFEAKTNYELVIANYPNSIFAQAALKSLLAVEKYATNDYQSLKSYYQTNPYIQSNQLLSKIAESLANWCDVYSENYQSAINWFEDVIQNPESLEDSVFAIIDIGYTYFLMEDGGYKSSYSCKFPEYRFESFNDYSVSVDYHLGLLKYDSEMNETILNSLNNRKPGELLHNIPNPFKQTTQIWYKLENESTVELNVYNYTGQLIRSINEGTKTKGNHFIDFDATGLINGIYFYAISINGQTTDSKKMTIMK